MTGFKATYLTLERPELVRYLLHATAQNERETINPHDLMTFLKLDFLRFNFARELPEDAKRTIGGPPRALLSFADRIIATDEALDDKRGRFSVLHEIGHYILPNHEHTLFVCDETGLSNNTRLVLEREANEFAADLLFLGDRFAVEANARPISASTIKELALKYQASFEATARRLVDKNFRHCMLVIFERNSSVNTDVLPTWSMRYCVASPMFRTHYYEKVTGSVPPAIVAALSEPGRDFAQSYQTEVAITNQHGEESTFQAEFFSNTYSIFCLLTPVK